ncbi:MAG: nitrate/nitrite transporter NarK [Cryomorphaceae bacterium]|jgi:nitrate/nitrite transporter NarK
MTARVGSQGSRFLIIFALVFAAEANFSLPFHVARFFRPTVLEVFQFTNTQLGDVFAFYGVVAMASYFLGGVIADRYSARALMSLSLLATAAGGLAMASIPGATWMTLLYGYWGATTILLFWAAMIRATRHLGGERSQGQAFGILDGGRGLMAAASASIAVLLLSWLLPTDVALTTDAQRTLGLKTVIYFYSAITLLAAGLVWFIIPNDEEMDSLHVKPSLLHSFSRIVELIRWPQVWAQAGIIVCAYCAYKGLDNYALYAVEVLGFDELKAARLASNAAYLRIVGAIAAGFIADRFSAGKIILLSFLLLAISYSALSRSLPAESSLVLIYGNLLVTFLFAFGLRGIYFALLEESKTPKHLTGTTVGLVSGLGFTPDIFFYPIAGRILDSAPGAEGHQHYFAALAAVMLLGLLITISLLVLNRKARAGIPS